MIKKKVAEYFGALESQVLIAMKVRQQGKILGSPPTNLSRPLDETIIRSIIKTYEDDLSSSSIELYFMNKNYIYSDYFGR